MKMNKCCEESLKKNIEFIFCYVCGKKLIKDDQKLIELAFLDKEVDCESYYDKNKYIFGINSIKFPKINLNDKYVIYVKDYDIDFDNDTIEIKSMDIYQLNEYAEKFDIKTKNFSKWYEEYTHPGLTNGQIYLIFADKGHCDAKFIEIINENSKLGEISMDNLKLYMEKMNITVIDNELLLRNINNLSERVDKFLLNIGENPNEVSNRNLSDEYLDMIEKIKNCDISFSDKLNIMNDLEKKIDKLCNYFL